jgi:hypothetical protein
MSSSRLKPLLNPALSLCHQERSGVVVGSTSYCCDGSEWLPCGIAFRKRAQNSGITVIATKYEANSEITTASANAVNKYLLTP